MTGRRGAGEGSIRERSNGLWEGRIDTGTLKPDGRRDVRSVYAPTRAAVQRKLATLRRQLEDGGTGNSTQTVAAYLTTWLADREASVRAKTHASYSLLLSRHVVPSLGRKALTDVSPADVQALYRRLSAHSPSLARHVHSVLHVALAHAVKRELVARNVADLVDVPRAATHETHVPTVAEVRQLLSATTDDRLYALWLLAVHTGARQGELLGLQWGDVDWEAGTIAIRRALAATSDGQPIYDETKTRRSRRTLTVPTTVLVALRAHEAQQDGDREKTHGYYQEYGLIFATSLGTAQTGRNITRAFKAALQRAGLPGDIRFHDLRHAAATAMLAAGVPLKVASERLGHSAVAITADLYTHRVASLEADAAERLAALFAPEGPAR